MSMTAAKIERLAAASRAWTAARSVRPSLRYVPGRAKDLEGLPVLAADRGQLQFHKAPHVIRCCAPGNGWGKTAVVAVEIDWWGHGDHPWPTDIPRDKPRSMVWIAQTFSQWESLRKDIEPWWPRGVVESWRGQPYHDYTWPDGSTLRIITSETRWENVQGIQPDLVAGDERIPPKLAAEMLMRRRGKTRTRYIFNGTSTDGLDWVYKDIYLPWKKYHAARGVTDEREMMRQQLHDYGDVIPELQGLPGIWCWPIGGHYDNPTATSQTWAMYKAQVKGHAAEKAVRLHGGFRSFAGQPVFNLDALESMRSLLVKGTDGAIRESA